jgi:TusA-related sulfurtransferase
MTVIKIDSQANEKPPIVIEYKGNEYQIEGTIPVAFFEVITSIPQSKTKTPEELKQYEESVGLATTQAFLSYVLPADLKKVLNTYDVGQVLEVWANHVQLGEESASTK